MNETVEPGPGFRFRDGACLLALVIAVAMVHVWDRTQAASRAVSGASSLAVDASSGRVPPENLISPSGPQPNETRDTVPGRPEEAPEVASHNPPSADLPAVPPSAEPKPKRVPARVLLFSHQTQLMASSLEASQLATPSPTRGLPVLKPTDATFQNLPFEAKLRSLRQYGLDIVLTFDSTGSMGGEIGELKMKIARISSTLTRLVPGTRISICTYRDVGRV